MLKSAIFITSVINTPNIPLSYSKVRSIYTRDERFEQTKITIESIKKKMPNTIILLVEFSDFTNYEEQEEYLKTNVHYYLNLWYSKDREYLKEYIYSHIKALGECKMTIEIIKYMKENNIFKNYDIFYKISGRYYLNDKFDNNIYYNYNIVNNEYYNKSVITITEDIAQSYFYKLTKKHLNKYNTFLIIIAEYMKQKNICLMYENILYYYCVNNKNIILIKNIKTLFINGNCAVDGNKVNND